MPAKWWQPPKNCGRPTLPASLSPVTRVQGPSEGRGLATNKQVTRGQSRTVLGQPGPQCMTARLCAVPLYFTVAAACASVGMCTTGPVTQGLKGSTAALDNQTWVNGPRQKCPKETPQICLKAASISLSVLIVCDSVLCKQAPAPNQKPKNLTAHQAALQTALRTLHELVQLSPPAIRYMQIHGQHARGILCRCPGHSRGPLRPQCGEAGVCNPCCSLSGQQNE